MLIKYPTKYKQRRIRFTDEIYYKLGAAENRHFSYRKKSALKRKKLNYIRLLPPKSKGKKRSKYLDDDDPARDDESSKSIHFQAAIGYDFKTPLYEYSITSNTNGKMTSDVYIQLLTDIVVKQIKAGDDFILEEDRDGSYSTANTRRFKDDNSINYYLNAPSSPDLSAIETVIGISKFTFRKESRFTNDDVRKAAIESQNSIS